MKTTLFNKVSNSTVNELIKLADSLEAQRSVSRRDMIEKNSPYSVDINKSITTYDELHFYCNLGLTEALVTRRSLIREIDTSLFITSKNKTNLELMKSGNPPYAYDDEDGIIELHHIGQEPEAPFAELTHSEHMMHGNSKKLHRDVNESWRNSANTELLFAKERSSYWKKRAKDEIKRLRPSCPVTPVGEDDFQTASSVELLSVIARLYAEISPEDLRFISDSAKMHAFFKEFGARSFSEFADQNIASDQKRCTSCDSEDYCSYGTYMSNGEKKQRYKCKNCGQIFTSMQRSIVSESKLSFPTWINLITCLYYGMSVAATAKMCNLSTKSVQNNRLRLFYALKVLDDKVSLKGKIAIDETYFAVSFKGNRTERKGFTMDRKAHKRGSENHIPGLSKKQVCVVCALDEYGNSVARVAGVGAPDHTKIQQALRDSINKEEVVCLFSDKELALRKYAEANGHPIEQIKAIKGKRKSYDPVIIEKEHWLQKINSFHSRLKKFMSKFSGISSDMLYGYLCLFTWISRNRDKEPIEAYKELFGVMIQPNLYKSLDEISNMTCFRDITVPKEKKKKMRIENLDRAKVIYAKYATGETVIDIAREYGCSRTAIYNQINKMEQLGYGYKTEKEKRRDEALEQTVVIPYPYERSIIERNRCIYNERMAWTGPAGEFYKKTADKYNLSQQTIKLIVSEEKRILSLQEPITVLQSFEHNDLSKTYQSIYSEYSRLVEGGIGKGKAVNSLAEKYNYSEDNILKIIRVVKTGGLPEGNRKTKTAKTETAKRDKELFSDYLRWEASKRDFFIWAQKKYGLSNACIRQILQFHYVADPNRYEMTYEYPTQHKG